MVTEPDSSRVGKEAWLWSFWSVSFTNLFFFLTSPWDIRYSGWRILVPQPEIEPLPLAVEAQTLAQTTCPLQ